MVMVSVIMPCFKMGQFIGEALASVGAQTYPHWEVIAVDDAGPDDGTAAAVAAFARQFPGHRVEYVRHEANRGVSAARNTSVRAARGEWLAFLDPDDTWFPEKLQRQLDRVRTAPDIVGCFAFGRIERTGAGHAYAPTVEVMGAAPAEGAGCSPQVIAGGQVMFPFSSVLVRREVVEGIGGFQESLPFQNEDRLLLGCVSARGQITWLPEVLCAYRVHDGSATTAVLKQEAATMVEFDLGARLALWLRAQKGLRSVGRSVVQGPVRSRLRELHTGGVWFRWRGLVVDLSARLAVAYPSQLPFLGLQFLRQSPLVAFSRRVFRLAWQRMSSPGGVF